MHVLVACGRGTWDGGSIPCVLALPGANAMVNALAFPFCSTLCSKGESVRARARDSPMTHEVHARASRDARVAARLEERRRVAASTISRPERKALFQFVNSNVLGSCQSSPRAKNVRENAFRLHFPSTKMYNASTALLSARLAEPCPWWSMGPRQASGSSMRSGIRKGRKGATLPRRNSLSPPPLLRQATVTRDDAVAAKFLLSPDAQQPNLILRLKREGKEWKCVSFPQLPPQSPPERTACLPGP